MLKVVFFSRFLLTIISFSFEFVNFVKNIDVFWTSLGGRLQRASCHSISTKISSPETFHEAFAKREWDRPIVLLIDELSRLTLAPSEIKDNFLYTLREVQHNKRESAITSVIAAGTFSIMRLNTTSPLLSPFNIAGAMQTPYFSLDETRQLFNMFERDQDIVIESAVVNDIWEISNGYAWLADLTSVAHIYSGIQEWSAFVAKYSQTNLYLCSTMGVRPFYSANGRGTLLKSFMTRYLRTTRSAV